jgi:hypothetical protein
VPLGSPMGPAGEGHSLHGNSLGLPPRLPAGSEPSAKGR